MPGAFLPILGLVASAVMSVLFRPKAPKAPEPAPVPKAPEAAPLPTPPAPVQAAQEPTVSPEAAQAANKDVVDKRKRMAASLVNQPDPQNLNADVGFKTLLGE